MNFVDKESEMVVSIAKSERINLGSIHEHEFIQLNAQDALRFFDALAELATFNEKLTEPLLEHDCHICHGC